MSVYDHYGLDPDEIEDRLETPETVRGQARELYEMAEVHFDKFEELLEDYDSIDEAMYELESADYLLEKAELDTQERDGAHHVITGDEL